MKVFLDTNVLAGAFATRGLCADLFRVVIAEHDLVVGEVVIEELRRVLTAKFRIPADRVAEVEELLRGCVANQVPFPIASPRAFWDELRRGGR